LIFCFRQELQPLECTQNRNIVVKCQTKYLYFYYNNYNNYNNFIIILFIILFFYLRICTYSTIVILKHVKSLKLTNISLPFEKKKEKNESPCFRSFNAELKDREQETLNLYERGRQKAWSKVIICINSI